MGGWSVVLYAGMGQRCTIVLHALIFFIVVLRGLCPTTYPDIVCRGNYTLHHYDPPLLYNLNSDPGEIYNLDVSKYSDVMAQITKVCRRVL